MLKSKLKGLFVEKVCGERLRSFLNGQQVAPPIVGSLLHSPGGSYQMDWEMGVEILRITASIGSFQNSRVWLPKNLSLSALCAIL
jgi:hypothetical protein